MAQAQRIGVATMPAYWSAMRAANALGKNVGDPSAGVLGSFLAFAVMSARAIAAHIWRGVGCLLGMVAMHADAVFVGGAHRHNWHVRFGFCGCPCGQNAKTRRWTGKKGDLALLCRDEKNGGFGSMLLNPLLPAYAEVFCRSAFLKRRTFVFSRSRN